ncbi:MAG: hypothetical protein SFZ23_06370 [Planctomycetota bacterium]|nr:hypothetical protein [Planctomycetota bacterium]
MLRTADATSMALDEHVSAAIASAWRHWPVAGACVLASLAFVWFKGLSLRAAVASQGQRIGRLPAARLFAEGVAIELVSWPSKLWADVYRVSQLPTSPLSQRISGIAIFRVAAVVSTGATLAVGVALQQASFMLTLALLVGLAIGLTCLLARRACGTFRAALRAMPSALAASACDVLAVCALAYFLGGVSPEAFVASFVVVSLASSLASLPQGLGTIEAGLWLALTQRHDVAPSDATAIVALYRLTGPGVTTLIGAMCLPLGGLLLTRKMQLLSARGRFPEIEGDASRIYSR